MMCSHSQLLNQLRSLLFKIEARDLSKDPSKCSCGCVTKLQVESEQEEKVDAQDHREVCSSIDGCDTTR